MKAPTGQMTHLEILTIRSLAHYFDYQGFEVDAENWGLVSRSLIPSEIARMFFCEEPHPSPAIGLPRYPLSSTQLAEAAEHPLIQALNSLQDHCWDYYPDTHTFTTSVDLFSPVLNLPPSFESPNPRNPSLDLLRWLSHFRIPRTRVLENPEFGTDCATFRIQDLDEWVVGMDICK